MLSKALSSMLPEIIKEIKKDGFNVSKAERKLAKIKQNEDINKDWAQMASAATPRVKEAWKVAKPFAKRAWEATQPYAKRAAENIGEIAAEEIVPKVAERIMTKITRGGGYAPPRSRRTYPKSPSTQEFDGTEKSLDSKKKLRREVNVKKVVHIAPIVGMSGLAALGLAGAAGAAGGIMAKAKGKAKNRNVKKYVPVIAGASRALPAIASAGRALSTRGALVSGGLGYVGGQASSKSGEQTQKSLKKSSTKGKTPLRQGLKAVRKGTAGAIGGGTVGAIAGGVPGTLAGGAAGHLIEEAIMRPKKVQHSPSKKVAKGAAGTIGGAAVGHMIGGIPGSIVGGAIGHIGEKKLMQKPVTKGYLGNNNSELTSATSKVIRDNDRFTEDTVTTLSRKDQNMVRSELDMAKSRLQASMKVEKAIFYLQGYEPMDDAQVKKSFHGQIPDLMKEVENRPPQDWWVKTINKSSAFDNDPIQYTADLWYGDLNKAVAEPIDGKYIPKKKGEDNRFSDGTRVDVSDLVGEKKSETTETL
jgi:hypothetical protein